MSDQPTPRPYECEKCGQLHLRCLAHSKRHHGPCGQMPLNGSDFCRTHGGTGAARSKAEERVALAEITRLHDKLGIPRPVDPGDAILELVAEAAGNVEFWRTLVQRLELEPGKTDMILDPSSADGELITVYRDAIYEPTFHQNGRRTGEARAHIIVAKYDEERDRLAKYSKLALDAKIDERRMKLAEFEARQLFADLAASIMDAGLTFEQAEKLRRGLAARLRKREAEHAQLVS